MNIKFSTPYFWFLWLGQVLSQGGLRMFQIAIVWWIVTSLGDQPSGKELGIFMVMSALPAIFLVKIIGKTIDRTSSKKVLTICNLGIAIIIGAITLMLDKSLFTFTYGCAAMISIALMQAFINPTLNRAVTEIVHPEEIEKAVTFQVSTQSLANFSGAVMGAMLISQLGVKGVVLLTATSYFLSAIINSIIHFHYACKLKDKKDIGQVSGWKILEDIPLIKRVLFGFGAINFFSVPIIIILPLYTNKTLHAGPSVFGMLEASIWIGILAGTFSAPLFNFVKSTIKLGSRCLFVLGFCLFIPGILINQYTYMVFLFIAGFALGVNNVKFISLFQKSVKQEIKGRFFALMQALISFTFPISYFLFGLLSDFVNPPTVCLIQGFGIMCVAGFFFYLAKNEHLFDKPLPPAV